METVCELYVSCEGALLSSHGKCSVWLSGVTTEELYEAHRGTRGLNQVNLPGYEMLKGGESSIVLANSML